MGALHKLCFWVLSASGSLPVPEAPVPSENARSLAGPRIVGRNHEGGLLPHDVAFIRYEDGYKAVSIDEINPDGSLKVSHLSTGKTEVVQRSELSREVRPELLEHLPVGQIPKHFDLNDPIQLTYIDDDGRRIFLKGNYMGFNSEQGYFRFVDENGKKIGLFPDSIVAASIYEAKEQKPETLKIYHDAPSGMFQIVTSKDPLLAEQNAQWMDTMRKNGVDTNYSREKTYDRVAAIEKVWREKIVPTLENSATGKQYGEKKMKLFRHFAELDREYGAQAKRGIAFLGEINEKKYAVCLDLSLSFHYMLAEMGVASSVVTGTVPGGRHAWVEIYDPLGRPVAIVDSNNTRSMHRNFQEYRQAIGSRSATDMFVEHRQVIRQEGDFYWSNVSQ